MSALKAGCALLAAATLAACSALPSHPLTTDRTMETEVVDARSERVPPDAAADLRFASFPLIQGSMSGPSTADPVLYLPVRVGFAAQLPLVDLAAKVAPLARPASDQMKAEGLAVEPPDTRLARVGTFFVRQQQDKVDVSAGFLDEVTRETLFLVYFDRACRVKGTVRTGGVEIQVDAAVAAPGLYWLRIRKDDATHWRMAPDETQSPIALVTNGQS